MRMLCCVLLELVCCVVVASAETLDERTATDKEWGYRPAAGTLQWLFCKTHLKMENQGVQIIFGNTVYRINLL